MEGMGWFSLEILKRMVRNHPECEFIFFFDRQYAEEFVFAENVTPVVLHPQARHPFLYIAWFEWSISRALKKLKPDVFLSPDGFLSLSTKTPSIPVIHDINFLHHPENTPFLTRNYYNYFFPRFAKKAARIATVSEYSKADVSKSYGILPENIDVIPNGLREGFFVLSEQECDEVRLKWTKGSPYFIYVGALINRKNLVGLFKAFDLFCQANPEHKLVIVGDAMWGGSYVKDAFHQMKNQERVIFTGHLIQIELNQLLSAATALTFVPFFEGFGVPIIEAFAAGTAVITSNTTSLPEVAGEAAILVDPKSPKAISDAMLQLTVNDALRMDLIHKGLMRVKEYNWEHSAELMWNCIMHVVHDQSASK